MVARFFRHFCGQMVDTVVQNAVGVVSTHPFFKLAFLRIIEQEGLFDRSKYAREFERALVVCGDVTHPEKL